jgi:hypothetical protein
MSAQSATLEDKFSQYLARDEQVRMQTELLKVFEESQKTQIQFEEEVFGKVDKFQQKVKKQREHCKNLEKIMDVQKEAVDDRLATLLEEQNKQWEGFDDKLRAQQKRGKVIEKSFVAQIGAVEKRVAAFETDRDQLLLDVKPVLQEIRERVDEQDTSTKHLQMQISRESAEYQQQFSKQSDQWTILEQKVGTCESSCEHLQDLLTSQTNILAEKVSRCHQQVEEQAEEQDRMRKTLEETQAVQNNEESTLEI